MNEDELTKLVKSILMEYFNISNSDFNWEKSLEDLNEDFGILGVMLDFERLLQQQINEDISILNHVDPTFNTPKDIVSLIKR